MHIIFGLLGTIVTILILLNRLADAGIDLGGLNPFLWSRRRKWRKQYEGNPVFKIENPMDANRCNKCCCRNNYESDRSLHRHRTKRYAQSYRRDSWK